MQTNILQDFSMATRPVSFFVYVHAWDDGSVHWHNICLDNGQTKERLIINIIKTIDHPRRDPNDFWKEKLVLISQYPVGANQGWIEANEQEIVEWDYHKQNRLIFFDYNLEINGGNV
jgi:hypothetical protein